MSSPTERVGTGEKKDENRRGQENERAQSNKQVYEGDKEECEIGKSSDPGLVGCHPLSL